MRNFDDALDIINKNNPKNKNNDPEKEFSFQKTDTAVLLEFMYLIHQENMGILASLTDKETLDKVKSVYTEQADKIIKEYSKIMAEKLSKGE